MATDGTSAEVASNRRDFAVGRVLSLVVELA
jgi:hypothetical protein